jgi:hypothetical protein
MKDVSHAIYYTTLDGQPVRVLAFLFSRSALLPYPSVALCDLTYQADADGRMPDKELERLHNLEEQLCKSVEQHNAVWLGHYSGGGKYTIVFRTKGSVPMEHKIKLGFMKSQSVWLRTIPDPSLAWHDSHMVPTDQQRMESDNSQVFAAFAKQGDRASAVRPVDTYVVLPTQDAIQAYLDKLKGLGYTIQSHHATYSDESKDYYVEAVIPSTLEPEAINTLTWNMYQLAQSLGGEYDGWAAPNAK